MKPIDRQPDATQQVPPELGPLDKWLDAPMWIVSLLFLLVLGGALQQIRTQFPWDMGLPFYEKCLFILWPLFAIEWILHFLAGSKNRWWNALYCAVPPLRMGGRDHATWRWIWMPFAGWKHVDKSLVRRIDKDFSAPMVIVALLVLPVLGVEWFWRDAVDRHDGLRFVLETGMTIIWIAFAFELIIMTSIVRNKVAYCVGHWIDLFIVLTPFLTFMPALRLLQLGRVASAGRLVRVYRVRGVLLRTYRAILLLEVVRRLVQINPARRLEALSERLEDQLHAVQETRREMAELELKIAAKRASKPPIAPAAPPAQPRGARENPCE